MTAARAKRYQASLAAVGGAMTGRSAESAPAGAGAAASVVNPAPPWPPVQHQVDDFLHGAGRRVDDDGVGGNGERGNLAGRVDVVAPGDVGGHLVVVHVEHLLAAPLSALLVAGGHINLYWSFRENDRPDVAALDHARALSFGPLALAPDQLLAHLGVDGHDANGPRHLGAADLDRGVHIVHHHPLGHVQFHVGGQLGHRRGVLGVDPAAYGAEGNGPVHGPGVEVRHPQLGRHRPGHGRFARTGRAVDGDDSLARAACSAQAQVHVLLEARVAGGGGIPPLDPHRAAGAQSGHGPGHGDAVVPVRVDGGRREGALPRRR